MIIFLNLLNCLDNMPSQVEYFLKFQRTMVRSSEQVKAKDTFVSWSEVFVEAPVEDVGYVWAEGVARAGVHRMLSHLAICHTGALESQRGRVQLTRNALRPTERSRYQLLVVPAGCWVIFSYHLTTKWQWPSFHLE